MLTLSLFEDGVGVVDLGRFLVGMGWSNEDRLGISIDIAPPPNVVVVAEEAVTGASNPIEERGGGGGAPMDKLEINDGSLPLLTLDLGILGIGL
jgi:hypothetical protein